MLDRIKKTGQAIAHATHALFEVVRDELGFSENQATKSLEALFEAYSLAQYLPDDVYDEEAGIFTYQKASHLMLECTTLIGASEETVTLLSSILTDILPPDSVLHALFD